MIECAGSVQLCLGSVTLLVVVLSAIPYAEAVNPTSPKHRGFAIAFLFTSVLLSAVGCTGQRIVFGNIPPSTFQFTTVIKHDGTPEPGGWQVAQVVVLLGRLSTMFPRAAFCDVEVGTPIVNRQQGYIPEEMAQVESALAADSAAREMLQARELPTAPICYTFRETMMRYLADPQSGTIAGARVSGFRTWKGKKIPRRTFPPKRGRH